MVKVADDTKARVMLTRRFFSSVRVESETGGASATSGDKRCQLSVYQLNHDLCGRLRPHVMYTPFQQRRGHWKNCLLNVARRRAPEAHRGASIHL
ncbi:hypothetical protein KC342_g64 [Hortaea werneckii]|nr:hypothetical protein KC342_g64 [Hortaea werneckii]